MATVDLGKISFVNKGTYDASTTYEERDVVQFTDGALSSYVYINATPASGQTPSTGGSVNSSHWSIFAGGVSLGVGNNKIVTTDGSGNVTGLSGNNKILTTNASGVPTALSIGSAGEFLRTNSSANGFEFAVADSGKTLKVQQFSSNTRTSLPSQDIYDYFSTNYTQVKANSKIRVDIHLIGFNNSAGAINHDLIYDGTTYQGQAIYVYTAQPYPHVVSGIYYINGSGTAGSKAWKFRYDHASSSGRPFSIWNPSGSDDNRLQQTTSTVTFTEYDF